MLSPRHVFTCLTGAALAASLLSCGTSDARRPSLLNTEPAPAMTLEESQRGDFTIRVSPVTANALRSMGLSSEEAIAAWFNEPPPKSDPFVDSVDDELQRARAKATKAETLEELELSPATIEILDLYGVRTPSALATFDLSKLADGRRCEQVCRADIVRGMRRAGWTCLNTSVTNRPRASRLNIDGKLLGRLNASSTPLARQFLAMVPGSAWDQAKIVTLSVDIPDAEDGMPPVRWFKDIELQRGGEMSLSVDVLSAPIPSIGVRPTLALGPGVVYAGDRVELFLEGGSKDSVWMVIPSPAQLTPSNFDPSPSGSDPKVGLAAWFEMRRLVSASSRGRSGVLEGSTDPSRQIGIGGAMTWRPRFETPSATVITMVKGPDGFWGMATRTIAVVDLRPGYWLMPNLALASAPPVLKEFDSSLPPGSSMNIYLTHWVLAQLTYAAQVNRPVDFEIRSDELIDASLPLVSATVDFGDGSAPVTLDPASIRSDLSHRFEAPGTYRIAFTTTDSMGLSRVQTTSVRVDPAPPPPPPVRPAAATASLPPPPQVAAPKPSLVNTTFDLLRRAVTEWAGQVASMAADSAGEQGMAIAHIHEERNRGLLDLMDHSLVTALLGRDVAVFEREPVFQAVLEARGFALGGSIDLEGQKPDSQDRLLVAAGEHPNHAEKMIDEWLARVDAAAPPNCELLLDYKLKRAEVRVQEAGSLALRTVRLLAFVRLHDIESGRILADGTVATEISDTVPRSGARPTGASWDSFPDGFMMVRESN
jgi:hypothetical protein